MKQEAGTTNQELLKRVCADVIVEFGEQFEIIQKIYDELGLFYPDECYTNYRDAWFHFRKLYPKRDQITILNEKYGLEEHLLRANKDAQINFLQQVGQWLEIWYEAEDSLTYKREYEGLYIELLDRLDKDCENNWVNSLWKYSGEDEIIFSNACVYYYKKNIYSAEMEKTLQKLLHGLKNLILNLRLGGVNIYRPASNTQYLKECVQIYNMICASLEKTGMIFLLSSTGVIWSHCKKKRRLRD